MRPRSTALRIDIAVSLDGHDLQAVLDTSIDTSTIDATIADRTMGVDDRLPGAIPIAGAKPGDLAQAQYRFKSLTLNGVAVRNPLFAIQRDRAEAAFERDEGKAASAIYGDTAGRRPASHRARHFDPASHLHRLWGAGDLHNIGECGGAGDTGIQSHARNALMRAHPLFGISSPRCTAGRASPRSSHAGTCFNSSNATSSRAP